MSRSWSAGAGMLLALLCVAAHAQAFPVTGAGASGHPGDRVFVDLIYDYGAHFGVTSEDLQFTYQSTEMTFVPDASTIDVFGTPQTLHQYADSLRQFAALHQGTVLENVNYALHPGLNGYAMSFYTSDGAAQVRSGIVHLDIAFDILADASPGAQTVSFVGDSLVDEFGNESAYPDALQHLSVQIAGVPEPPGELLVLSGLIFIGLNSRRRAKSMT